MSVTEASEHRVSEVIGRPLIVDFRGKVALAALHQIVEDAAAVGVKVIAERAEFGDMTVLRGGAGSIAHVHHHDGGVLGLFLYPLLDFRVVEEEAR